MKEKFIDFLSYVTVVVALKILISSSLKKKSKHGFILSLRYSEYEYCETEFKSCQILIFNVIVDTKLV